VTAASAWARRVRAIASGLWLAKHVPQEHRHGDHGQEKAKSGQEPHPPGLFVTNGVSESLRGGSNRDFE